MRNRSTLRTIMYGMVAFVLPLCAQAQVISEIHFHPACSVNYTPCEDAREEFLELYHPGPGDLDLSGFVFVDGIEFEFPSGTTLQSGEYLVLADDELAFEAAFGFAPFGEWSGQLKNGGERLALANDDGSEVFALRYGDGVSPPGEFSILADGEGASLQLDLNGDPQRSRFWTAGAPSPGAPSTAPSAFAGVENLSFTLLPNAVSDFVVTADIYGSAAPVVRFKVNYPGTLIEVPMTSDDGVHYSAHLDANAFESGDLLRFGIFSDNFRIAPKSDDSIDHFGTTVSDDNAQSTLPVLEWFTSDANYNAGFNEEDDTTYDGVIAIEGRVHDNVGFRIRGGIARSELWEKRNWKFKLPAHHSIEIPGMTGALDTLDVQGGYADESRIREFTGHTVAGEMGLVASEVLHLRVQKNGVYFGLHTLQEHPEGNFLKRRGLENATLYKGALPVYYNTPQNGPFVRPARRATFENWDIPNYINLLAAGSILQHNDFAHGNFYWWFNAYKNQRFEGMIWDLDLSQGIRALPDAGLTLNIGPASGSYRSSLWSRWRTQADPLLYDVLTTPVYREMYLRRVQVLADEWYGSGRFESIARAAFANIDGEWELDTAEWGFYGDQSFSKQGAIDRHSDLWIDGYYAHLLAGGPDGDIPDPQPANPSIELTVDFDPLDPRAEAIRLKNLESVAIDVSGWRIEGDVSLILPPGAVLPAGRSAYVVHDDSQNGFRAITQNLHVFAAYSDELSNIGGTVELLDLQGAQSATVSWGTPPNPGLILNEWNAVGSGKFLGLEDGRLGHVLGNGGDWFELVVTEEGLDLRGWQLQLFDEGAPGATLTFSNDALLADIPVGTILTIAENAPQGEDGTLYNEDALVDPAAGDYWMNLVGGNEGSGQFISAQNFKVSNDDWQIIVYDAQGNRRFGRAGEGVGTLTNGGVRSDQIGELEEHPSAQVSARSLYDDGDGSTFGAPNFFDNGLQDFENLRDIDRDGTVNALDACPFDAQDDSDGDGLCDSDDLCPGFDDAVDTDSDGIADGCDACPLDAPDDDDDDDGVCDSDDLCPGSDDAEDTDSDGAPDDCDLCPLDTNDDSDDDGSCDSDDICAGFDDRIDSDGDGTPDGCDLCPLDINDDSDGDGRCDSDDLCPGNDDRLDADGDGAPDACDICPLDVLDDSDGDGSCDSDDICAGFDDRIDSDSDGLPEGCDLCPLDPANDGDGDGVCEPEDRCPGFDDRNDADGDGQPDACDACPQDAPNDSDSDGVCDSNDICAGFDDRIDTDSDGIPNGCDECASNQDQDGDGQADDCDPCPVDVLDDSDGDGSCDSSDRCPGFDDSADEDGDELPDACDLCPQDNPNDSDDDGVCESEDRCPGADDLSDQDGDGTPDGCDLCPLDSRDDSDADGSCDSDDLCPDFNDAQDADGDGTPDACDPCPNDAGDDSDADGVCDGADRCQGFDDRTDTNNNGIPNGCDDCTGSDDDGDGIANDCDVCPRDERDDSDGDGVCDSDDLCEGFDDRVDTNGDGVPDACEPCVFDEDGDGICDSEDICAGFDDNIDNDGDGVPEGCDPDEGGRFSVQGGEGFLGCQSTPGTPFSGLLVGLLWLTQRRRFRGVPKKKRR